MKQKIKSYMLAAIAATCAFSFTACSDDDDDNTTNIISEFSYNDTRVAQQKAQSGKDEAILLVAFGSTWSNAFSAFDHTVAEYQKAFPEADVYLCFSSDICINRASAGEHGESRNYYEPRYLLHAIGRENYAAYNDMDCFTWLRDKKAAGLVRHMGFSFHDDAEFLDQVLTEHPEMEFVQLQINYLDWDSEGVQSRKCYEVATRHGVPVIVMEPVKGGTLANVPEAVKDMFQRHQPDMSVASWAVRFTADLDNVFMVLSGMSNMEQLLDNTSYMMDQKPLSGEEQEIIRRAVGFINGSIAIPCTGCAYCVDGCPAGIPIPQYFSLYNADKQEMPGKSWTPQESYYVNLTKEFGAADQCLECGQCEQVCPQHLPIIRHLKEVAEHYKDA